MEENGSDVSDFYDVWYTYCACEKLKNPKYYKNIYDLWLLRPSFL
jgi:hypothetical protein